MNAATHRNRAALGFALASASLLVAIALQVGQVDSPSLALAVAFVGVAALVVSTDYPGAVGILRSPCTLFGIGLFACNLGETLLNTVGFVPEVKDPIARTVSHGADSYRSDAILVAMLGICAFSVAVTTTRAAKRARRQGEQQLGGVMTSQALLAALASLGFTAVFIVESVRTGTAAGLYAGAGEASRLLIFSSQMALTSAVICAALAEPRTLSVRLMWAATLPLLLFMSVLGWRGHSFAFFAAVLACRAQWLEVFPWKRVMVGYVVVALIWAVTADVRQTVVKDRNYTEALSNIAHNVGEVLAYPVTLAAAQEASLRYALAFANEYGWGGGTWYLNHLSYALPNVVGPAREAGSEVGFGLSATVSATYVGSYGIGLTPIGEAFVSFGRPGVLLVLFGAGLCAGLMEAAASRTIGGRAVAISGIVAGAAFWWLRNDSFQLFRFIAWGLALEASLFFVARLVAARRRSHAFLGRCAD